MDLSAVPLEFRSLITRRGPTGEVGVFGNFSAKNWRELPDWVTELSDLTHLYLYGNTLSALPGSIANLTNLTHLYLGKNNFSSFPAALTNLPNLAYINLDNNLIGSIPESIGNLGSLTHLSVCNNYLTELPETIGYLASLYELQLSGNELARLPDTIVMLRNCRNMLLEDNIIEQLPESIGNLTSLNHLSVENNQIEELPRSLADLIARGMRLELRNNPLRAPLPELVSRGHRELATYLRSLSDSKILYEAKLLLVGEGNVGKSSLVAALKGGEFIEGRPTTHGIEISPIQFPHPELALNMILRAWDFGGQEVYRISHQFFFSPGALFLVVWHARQGQERDEVEAWLRRIKLRVEDTATAIIVATHCAERLADLDYPYLERNFSGLLAGTFEVDSFTGEGITALRSAISTEAARLPRMGQRWSDRWTATREAILALSKDHPQIAYGRFTEICEENGVTGDEIETLAKLMHDLGLIIYYDSDEGLKDIVVLNPEWLTKAISYVLDDRVTAARGGVLDHARLRGIWQDRPDGYPARYHPYFLRLMEKFDISYRLEGDDSRSLVSQLVPHQRPALSWSYGSTPAAPLRSLSLTCRLSEAAPGLIPWLTVRHHRASTGRHWRRGVFLRHPIDAYHSEALIELVRDDELVLEVRAPSPDLYFNVLRDSIEDLITRRWPGLVYRMFISCPGTPAAGTRCPGRFALDGLLRIRERGRAAAVSCMDCGELYEISLLLTGFTAADRPLTAAVEQMHQQIAALAWSVGDLASGVGGLTGQAADIAATIRRVHRIVGAEVTDCPRLFTLGRKRPGTFGRVRFHQEHYSLTLWCEHPGHEHPWARASYDLDQPRQWFVNVAPYARLVLRTLQLAIPVAGAIDIALLPATARDDAQARLEVMKAVLDDLPADALRLTAGEFADRDGGTGKLTPAEGQALRAVRQLVFESDPMRAFGDMRRVQAPSGDLLWVCPEHCQPEYDPGLPKLA